MHEGLMNSSARDLFDPFILYAEHRDAIRGWVMEIWQYVHDLNAARTPGLGDFERIEEDLRRICSDNGFDLVRNAITSDEDRVYTLDIAFPHGLHQLVEMTTDMVDMVETEIEIDAMIEQLDECDIHSSMPLPSSWSRQAAHQIAKTAAKSEAIDLRAFDPSAIAALDTKKPGWRKIETVNDMLDRGSMRLPNGPIETEIETRAGIRMLRMRDHDRDWTWSNGELHIPRGMVSNSLLTGSVGRPVSAICQAPGLGPEGPVVIEARYDDGMAVFATDALTLDRLEMVEHGE